MRKIFISAAEASSDTHAAALIRALHSLSPEPLAFFGVGGPRSKEAGLEVLLPTSELLSMGLVEVLRKIPRIAGALRLLERVGAERRPDIAVVMDYPDFHFKLASRFQSLGIPVICMIPPKVWAWRQSRVAAIRKLYQHVITILPFEKELYEGWGVNATYVGNPLLDQLPPLENQAQVRRMQGYSGEDRVLLLMPGSRPAELKYHLEPMLLAASEMRRRLKQENGKELKVWIPLAPGEDMEPIQARIDALMDALPAAQGLKCRLSCGDAWDAMLASDAGIIKSGTSSLEAAILDLPHSVIYRGHPISEWAFKTFVRYDRPISLVNLIHDFSLKTPDVVPELILETFSVENMVNETYPLLSRDSSRALEMRQKFRRVRERLRQSQGSLSSPSELAARKILDLLGVGPSVQAGVER